MMKRMAIYLLILFCMAGMMMPALAANDPVIDELAPKDIPEPFEGQRHYLLLCLDKGHGEFEDTEIGNTDGIILVTLDMKKRQVMLTSIIRDLLVMHPVGRISRINYLARLYGPEELCKIIGTHLGVKVEKYLMFDWEQIAAVVDHMGGVDITVTAAEASHLRNQFPGNSTKPRLYSKAGTYHFNGTAAVKYMRIRKVGGGGDFHRTERARTVLKTLSEQFRTMDLSQVKGLMDVIMDGTTQSNLAPLDYLSLLQAGMSMQDFTLLDTRVPADKDVRYLYYRGMNAQAADFAATREYLAHFLQTGEK